MPINDLDATAPAAGDNVSAGDNEIRDFKQDIRDSFAGMLGNATDAVIATATGPQIEYAATTFTAALKATYDAYATAISNLSSLITTNQSDIADLQDRQQTYGGKVTVPTTITGGPSGWTVAAGASTGRYVVTHSLGLAAGDELIVTANAIWGGGGDRQQVMIVSSDTNSFEIFVTSDGSGAARDFHFLRHDGGMTSIPRIKATLRPNGIALDPDPSEVPEDLWTGGQNVISRNGYMQRVGGSQQVLDDPSLNPFFHISAFDEINSAAHWIYFQENNLYRQDGSGETNMIAPGYTGVTLGSETIADLSGGNLNGQPFMNKKPDPPWFWQFSGSAVGHTGWPTGDYCGVMWAFKYHLFAGDYYDNSATIKERPTEVRWSDATPPATLPNWTVGAGSEAGNSQLGEMRGRIQNGLPIRGSCAIYGQSGGGIYLCDYVGGRFAFRFRLFSTQAGLLARHGVVEARGMHFGIDDDTFWAHDGVNLQDIADGWVKREFFSQLNPEKLSECFAAYYKAQNEIWFCGPTSTNAIPNLAAVYDLSTRKWGLRSLGDGASDQGIRYARQGVVLEGTTAATWTTITGTWASQTRTWNQDIEIGNQDKFIAIDTQSFDALGDTYFAQIDATDTSYAGSAITGILKRHSLDFGEPDEVKTVRAVHPHTRSSGPIQVRAGGQYTEADAIDWSSWVTVDPATTQKASLFATGRLLSFEFKADNGFELPGFSVEGSTHGRY